MAVSSFYDLFPKIKYDINNNKLLRKYEDVTNIFYRIGIIREILNNSTSYFVYDIEDEDTPEILAEKFYGDPGAVWMILLTNEILDAQFEWPLNYNTFNQYIIEKYGSIETAQITPHHYEKVITRRNTRTDFVSETRFWVNKDRLTNDMPDSIPFSYYSPYMITDLDNGQPFETTLARGNLALTGDYSEPQIYTINGEPIEVTIKGEEIFCYDYEKRLNDDRRSIKVIKSDYYVFIQDELKKMLNVRPDYLRRLM